MQVTDAAAWWGAIMASLVFMWDIYKWKIEGPILRVTASPNMQILENKKTGEEKYIYVTVANIGSRKTTITHLIGKCYNSTYKRTINKPEEQFFVHTPAFSKPLPFQIDVGETWSGGIRQTDDLEKKMRNGILLVGVNDSSKKKATLVRVTLDEKR